MTNSYEPCADCRDARHENLVGAALACRTCKGTGFARTRDSYVCNKCAGPMCPDVSSPNRNYPHGLVDAVVGGGYDSPHLTDCTSYKFSLCEQCLRELFGSFRIPPTVDEPMLASLDGDFTYADDLDWYEFRQWRDSGGQKSKLATGICNYREHCQASATWRHFVSGHMTEESFCDEHKNGHANSIFVPARTLALLPERPTDRDHYQNVEVASAYLGVVIKPGEHLSYFRFLPDCLEDVVHGPDAVSQEQSGIFVPVKVRNSLTPELEVFEKTYLPIGLLLSGGPEEVLSALKACPIPTQTVSPLSS